MTSIKNYIGINRDHSGSMQSLKGPASRDFNGNIQQIQASSIQEGQETVIFVNSFGAGPGVVRVEERNTPVANVRLLTERDYFTSGQTPLFDSVGQMITDLESQPDAQDPNVAFLVMAITDGEENASKSWNSDRLTRKIQELQATDRWTFVFRVPRGYKRRFVDQMGIPEGNVLEWEQSSRGVEVASAATQQAYTSYFTSRSAGATSTKSFYQTNLAGVKTADVKKVLNDITSQVVFFDITAADNNKQIRAFVEEKLGHKMVKGGAFYQLTKKEDEVQDHKLIALRDKDTGKVFSGTEARNMLGLPYHGTVKVVPGNHGKFDIFIQSTSVNRSLKGASQVMYWNNVGVPYQS